MAKEKKPAAEVETAANPNKAKPGEMTKNDAYQLYALLGNVRNIVTEPKHVFTMASLRKKLEPNALAIDEIVKAPEVIKEWETKRLALCGEYAVKEEASGEAKVSQNGNILIQPDKRPEFEAKMNDLKAKYKDEIDAYNEQVKKVNAVLEEAAEDFGALPKIPLSALSKGITVQQMELLMPVLADDSAEVEAKAAKAAAAKG